MERRMEMMCLCVLRAGAMEIRDVDRGEKPFHYTSGPLGPGYISIKDLVGQKEIMKFLCRELAWKIVEKTSRVDFVAGNVAGGVIPAWLLSEELEALLDKTVPFVYIREARKTKGQKKLITGIANNPEIRPGANGLVVEELVNFAQTTCNSANALRYAGYPVTHAATILFYDNPEALKSLQEVGIEMVYLFTLPQLLEVAEKHQTHPQEEIDDYREFLKNPLDWQAKHISLYY